MSAVMDLLAEARAAGIAWRLDGGALKATVPVGARALLDRLRAARVEVETIVRAELMFGGAAVAVGSLQVKVFATEQAAHAWADQFAYARRVCRLEPLVVARLGDEWVVRNPDYPVETHMVNADGRVVRRTSGSLAAARDHVDLKTGERST